jgi:hypothetical protein
MSAATDSTSRIVWAALAFCLLLLRVPALVQPAGGDQGLYAYTAQRVLDGGVPYRAAWDQKPPGIFFVYALLERLWPDQSVVAMADLVVAALVAWLLIVLGRRFAGATAGGLAACAFLLFGHPSLTRLSGVYVRSQCETFIALAVTIALVLVSSPRRRSSTLVLAGLCLGVAAWLKYNALAYALPIAAMAAASPLPPPSQRTWLGDLGWIAAGALLVTVAVLVYFAANGALLDLRLATLDYNLQYAGETYAGPLRALAYVFTLPLLRARIDLLWFLGGIGAMLALVVRGRQRPAVVALVWIGAASLSIAVNGARDLPQYFVQAAPALAWAAGLGFAGLTALSPAVRYVAIGLVVVGAWRVGVEPAAFAGLRLGGLPQLIENIRFDVDRARGTIDRTAYLARFSGGKFDAVATDEMIRYVAEATQPSDPVFVFGFSGGSIGAWSGRRSPTRFFWSRPVMLGFEAARPGYDVAGLLGDLERDPPKLVILQKLDWHLGEALPNSAEFFLSNPRLRAWLEAGYLPDRETAMFAVWRRRG